MQLYCVLRMAWPALCGSVLTCYFHTRWLKLCHEETSGERARHLATLRIRKQRAEYKTEAKRPKSAESQDQRCVHLLANNCCSFSLEKQKSPPREFSLSEKDAPPCLDCRTQRILMHIQLFLLSFCRSYQHVLPNHTYCMLVREAYFAYAYL